MKVGDFFGAVVWPFLVRAFFSTFLWLVLSFLLSEFMPVMGVGLVDAGGKPIVVKFGDFIDRRLWLLMISSACFTGVFFSLLGNLLPNEDFIKKGLSSFKDESTSLLITFAAVLAVIYFRGTHDLVAILGSIVNYLLAFLVFNSKVKAELDQCGHIDGKNKAANSEKS
ncbi:hypothetical protein [Xanthomonas hortorum]|nr:hypothetical protein [Xanthomonas hortorum]MCE4354880.1 hypothetical protein [Xanthomonas hortorum pv. pelargonii]MCM5524301.1 hypothetical protein [Xanthomonas hortorum pv. pelargonii]MCM5536797.1 hypothetical protein [Xanthomonas hortorum pv. pelargonii]MCM5541039.1 hypothetical protein [Xanthomonas hortorum pv. pelargonii]MCM5544400.1 hypothetical protein [Xanthomonas hortorum pv. pelargonii]